MKELLNTNPLTSIIAVIVVIVGGVITVINPDTLTYQEYLFQTGIFLGGLGVWGLARSHGGKG